MRRPCPPTSLWLAVFALLGALGALSSVSAAQNPAGLGRQRAPRSVRPSGPAPSVPALHCIDFEGFQAGAIVSTLGTPLGAVTITGQNPTLFVPNAAIIFDSANPTGTDFDLGTPNEDFGGPGQGVAGEAGSAFANTQPKGKILIVAERMNDSNGDGLVDDPDDADEIGSTIELDFSATGPVEIESVFFIDGESDRPTSSIELYAPGGALLDTVAIQPPGNNGVNNTLVDVANVGRMVFRLNGSTAIDDICLRQFVDCDGNGNQDHEDIAGGAGDCNTNGIPDDCEEDCDDDGIPDECEPDCDSDGTPDDCEPDCDSDGTPDDCEVDCDNDGTPDGCEPDCDSDGTPDDCEPDCDLDGTPDDCEPDCDDDGTPDDCEADCDNDGTPDDCEPDCDADGVPDDCEPDCDSDGTPDDCENDCDGDGTPDDCEPDCDGDGVPDDCEADCDNDGLPDDCEPDCDNDGNPDDCEPDCDSDGTPDDCESDCDSDGTPDDCELDCDQDGTPDDCELDCDQDGTPDDCELDCDQDGTPDDCEPDCDQDGTPDDCEPDCDRNGTPDDCEPDCDMDGTPDGCEPDCDEDGTPDDCEPDCDMDGVPDDCELDENMDGTPDDCESSCPEPATFCSSGCYELVDAGHGGVSPPGFGLRLDHLFGPGSGLFTFSFEQPGTGALLCYDEVSGVASISGTGFGGLDIGATWDPDFSSYIDVNFVWTGVYCDGTNLIAPDTGAAYGTVTWLETGEVFCLYGQSNPLQQNARLWSFDGTWHGWIAYHPGVDSAGVQDWVTFVNPVAECPVPPDTDGDGTPDSEEPDCDGDEIPDHCEEDRDGNGVPDDCEE